jgi:hypothetical protein
MGNFVQNNGEDDRRGHDHDLLYDVQFFHRLRETSCYRGKKPFLPAFVER